MCLIDLERVDWGGFVVQDKDRLYESALKSGWQARYRSAIADPEFNSLRREIALQVAGIDRYLEDLKDKPFGNQERVILNAMVENVGRAKERENKRLYSERVVEELLTKQVAEESRILKEVLSEYLDDEQAERAARDFADRLGKAASSVGASVRV